MYFHKKIRQNKLKRKKYNTVYATRNYIEYLLILVSTETGCIPISNIATLLAIVIRAFRYKSITKKKKI